MKKNKNQTNLLDNAIFLLEKKRDTEFIALKAQLHTVYESVKPVNLLNQTLIDFNESPDIKSNILQSVISLAGGYLSKKIVFGNTHSIFKKVLGYVLQYGVTNFISKKVDSNLKDQKKDNHSI
jgi:hypothetical protein